MRICLYTGTALPKIGGQEMVVDALARQFQDLGHSVVVLAPRARWFRQGQNLELPYPVEWHPRFLSTRFLVPWYRWWLARLHRRWPFDVLNCHGVYPPGYLAALCRERLGIRTVITSHGDDVRPGNPRLARALLRHRHSQALENADALVSISRFTQEGYLRLCPRARRIVAIPNGVDLNLFTSPAARPANLDPAIRAGKYALFLGRLNQRKGVDLLLDALAKVPGNGQVQLVLAGDGDERSALLAQAQRLGLTGRIRFFGAAFGPAKAYLLQNALCTVMPSRSWEAFPLVVLESYGSGTPVIGTRVPGLEDLVFPGRTGWLVPAESTTELAEALHQALQGETLCQKLGQQARQVAQEYDWKTVAARYLALFQELCPAGNLRLGA